MKFKFRHLFPLIVASLSITGCKFFGLEFSITDEEKEVDVVVDTVVLDKYYKNYNLKVKGGELVEELQRMCFDKHTVYIPYSQLNNYYNFTNTRDSIDGVPGTKKIELCYSGKQINTYSSGSTREHVWPCANSDALWAHSGSSTVSVHNVDRGGYIGGGSDLYHVRPCGSALNTARGNSRFVDFDDEEFESLRSSVYEYTEPDAKYPLKIQGYEINNGVMEYAQKAEPADEMKGDIARIILYVWLHYFDRGNLPEGSKTSGGLTYKYSDMCGKLSLTDVMGYADNERCQEILKKWNKMDAPSNVEKQRNNVVQKIQGNRNPFVDYPNLVDDMFY